ncbi:cytosolic carboxypeptidase 1-like isoform X2 [Leptotrombidium deliense]|uniref:Cytosolic carboxypeptidase 1-like isoform X2 n=1 Tax=Leptotrombidium deliense TaxID=299467 RepID=A0A443SIH6_9ACAR|nr:cytosolic carboxypeptidase 1-like isoform X2 [Leptotrombidium deliense]
MAKRIAMEFSLACLQLLVHIKRGAVELINPSTNYLFILTKYLQDTLDNLEKKKLAFRSLRVMNAILCTFLHVGFVKAGREAMRKIGVERVVLSFMKDFFSQKINSKYCERIAMLCSLAIQRCLPPLQLPLTSFNPYVFALPPKCSKTEESIPANGAEKSEESSNDESNASLDGNEKRDDFYSGRSNASTDSSEKSDYEFFSNSECSRNNSSEDESDEEDIRDDNCAEIASYSQYFHELLLFPRTFEYSKDPQKEESSDEKDDSFFKIFLQTSKSRRNSIKRPSESHAPPDANYNRILDVHSVKEDKEDAEVFIGLTDEWKEVHSYMVTNNAKSVIPFVKIAECMHKEVKDPTSLQPLSLTENNLLNKLWFTKLLQHIDNRTSKQIDFDCIVYDIESNLKPIDSLLFESRFENANLRKVIKTGVSEYTLLLNTDVNTSSFGQWFFFEVTSMKKDVEYTFNIINCRKQRSLYREGVRPLLFSKKENELNNCSWKRVAKNITYYRNHFVDEDSVSCILHEDPYYTLTFSLTFPHENDTCYLAYNYPYTYSMLLTHLHFWQNSVENTNVYFNKQIICQTLSGNDVPLVTITNKNKDNKPQYVFLLARVHPSESPSSWNMKGVIDFLLSNQTEANLLRDKYVFKILPMMNPDGVINGNSRTSLSGDDLNRQWVRPDALMHPTIYHTKMLLKYISNVSKRMNPVFFCDFHGHSHRSNVFMYGCAPQLSWRKCDRVAFRNDYSCFIAPMLLNGFGPAFNLNYCSFSMDKTRKGTARITVWKEFGVQLSYTMECTHGGCDQGIYRSFHLGIEQLKEMGAYVCKILLNLQFRTNAGKMVPQMPESMRNQASEL